jgi:branched-chain amino acid transport system substrate-binding protein
MSDRDKAGESGLDGTPGLEVRKLLVGESSVSRRQFLRLAGAAGLAVGLGGLAGCGDDETATTAAGGAATTAGGGAASGRAIKLGYVTPQTGPLAGFGEADEYILETVRAAFSDGLDVGGTIHPVEILVQDSQSDPNRAAEVAGQLILDDGIDMMVVSSTPETTNPVSDQCEANGVPCLSTVAPWQPYFFGRNGDPATGFQWTYHFFWGLEDIIAVFLDMWNQVPTNKVVGALWPNDGDGNAWSDPELGFPPELEKAGYTIVDPGRYNNLTDDFSAQISQFKSAGVEIVTGVPIPPDFTTFWTQAAQQDFRPKIASIGKALLFPSSVEALGDLGDGLSTEVWWTPSHPFTSSLTGESAQALADGYTSQTSKQWTQPLGFVHALFEIAADTFKRTGDVDSKEAVRDALKATKLDTLVGPIDFSQGPVPNVAKTPLVGGQWGPGTDFQYDLTVVSNSLASNIPTGGELRPIPS